MYNLLKKYNAEKNLFVVYDEMRVLIYQTYTLMPNISIKKRKELFNEVYELEKQLNINEFDNFFLFLYNIQLNFLFLVL